MEWRRLTQPEEPAFGRAMALYEASFPRHEQRLPDEQRAVLSHPEYHFTQLFDGAEFVGLLLYWEAEDFRYVEHFAIAPQLRGQSWGCAICTLLVVSDLLVIMKVLLKIMIYRIWKLIVKRVLLWVWCIGISV